jgi:hypothetical protein
VEVNLDDFRRHFEILSDDALLETNREDLVEAARGCYDEEVARRGLNTPVAEPIAEEGSADHADPGDELVLIATYNIPEEANFARGLLQSAEIPFHLANEYVALGGFQLRLMVPKAFEEQALEVLETEISDEELAAQAEAAGIAEEEESEESGDA